jgi:hypothetical protein
VSRESELSKSEFLRCVEKHEMEVMLDSGVYRHLRFKAPDTGNQHFHLVTFPGRLVYCGDMGSFMFSRTVDMFDFFRRPDRGINLSYWGEKIVARDRDGVTEFSLDKVKDVISGIVKDQTEDWTDKKRQEADEELELVFDELDMDASDIGDVIRIMNEQCAPLLNSEWFSDLWDYSSEAYTYRFQWACYAIAWGIEQYDKFKEQNLVASATSTESTGDK